MEESGRVCTLIPLFSDQTAGFIEEVADQTGLELFSMAGKLSALSHVPPSFA